MGKAVAVFIAGIILFLILFFQISSSYKLNEQHFIYPLDDTYIHMAIAKNLANHGQWGLTPDEFSSSSSSILYTLIIAGIFKIFGISEFAPFIVNIICALCILLMIWTIAVREDFNLQTVFIITLLIIFFTPLPALMLSGMEHTLQILISTIFIYSSAVFLESDKLKRNNILFLYLLAFLTVMIRYEGIFIVVLVAFLFLLRKRKFISFLILFAGILPVLIFGLISINNGAYFLPNSLLLKAQRPFMTLYGLKAMCFGWLEMLMNNPHVLILFIVLISYFIYSRLGKKDIWNRSVVMVIIVALTMILHLTFARTGWFFRYEAYLVFLSLLSFSWILNKILTEHKLKMTYIWIYLASILLLLTFTYPLLIRGNEALIQTVPATKNIYEQHYQMAKFVKKYYNNSEVCLSDIGAVSFFTDIKLFDIFGLAGKEIVSLKIKGGFNKTNIYRISRQKHAKIAILYEPWFRGLIPDTWKKAGEWEITQNIVITGGEVISFYATEEYDVDSLKKNLRLFSGSLPRDVIERGGYLDEPGKEN